MKRTEVIEKVLVTLVLVAWYVWMPQRGYAPGYNDIPSHYLYMLSHANVWHLTGNLFVLWLMKGRLRLPDSMVIAVLASFVPVLGTVWDGFVPSGVTMGFSGVLFTMFGIRWGLFVGRVHSADSRKAAVSRFVYQVLPFALVGVLIPHINWCLHLYCLLEGFIYGRTR